MSLQLARKKREERGALHAKATEIIQKEKITPEDRVQFDAYMKDMDVLKGDIDRLERAAALEAEMADPANPGGNARREPPAGGEGSAVEEKHKRAFLAWGRNGMESLDTESRTVLMQRRAEARDMGIGTGAGGGFFIPQGFVYEIESAMKYYGDMLGVCSYLDTATGNTMPYPTDNDTTNTGELVGEGVQVSTQDVALGHVTFNAWKFSTKMIKISIELLQDSAFDFEAFLKEKMAVRLGRILNLKLTTGTGTNEPGGLITEATNASVVAVGSSANTGGAETGANSLGSKDYVAIEHQVDRSYRRGGMYMFHDSTLQAAKNLLDKYGRPLWTPGMANNAPDMINGYAYSINNDMAPIATGNKSLVFGQLKKYFVRRVRALAVMRLTERFADYGQVAFLGFYRGDGHLVDAGTNPVKYLTQA